MSEEMDQVASGMEESVVVETVAATTVSEEAPVSATKPRRKSAPAEVPTPVERSKRERKQVAIYNASAVTPSKSVIEIESGSGITLADYEYFTSSLERLKGDDEVVKSLHSLMYNSVGKKLETKKHLRQFSGFPAGTSVADKKDKLLENKKKWTTSLLKEALGLFGLEKSGSREDLISRLVDYLGKPISLKSGASSGKKRRSSSGRKKSAKKQKRASRPPTAFILFSNSIRKSIKESNPDASFEDIGRLIGQAWQNADEAVKQEWKDKAIELKGSTDGEEEGVEEDGGASGSDNEDGDDEDLQSEGASENDSEDESGADDKDDDADAEE